MRLAAVCVFVLIGIAASASSASAGNGNGGAPQSLTLANENLALTFSAGGTGGITLTSLLDKVTGHEYLSRPTSFFEFAREGGPVHRSNQGLVVDSVATSRNPAGLTISAHAADFPL